MILVQKRRFWDFLSQWQNNSQRMNYDPEVKAFTVTSACLNSCFKHCHFCLLLLEKYNGQVCNHWSKWRSKTTQIQVAKGLRSILLLSQGPPEKSELGLCGWNWFCLRHVGVHLKIIPSVRNKFQLQTAGHERFLHLHLRNLGLHLQQGFVFCFNTEQASPRDISEAWIWRQMAAKQATAILMLKWNATA